MGKTILNAAGAEKRARAVVPQGTTVKAFEMPCTDGVAITLHGDKVIQVGFLERVRQHVPKGSTYNVDTIGEDGVRFEAESFESIVAALKGAALAK